ncbi:phosphoribosyltransferase [Tetragenococcus solitarius]|uniref:Hypoxanthine-guanine phosphoribosyltransferase n=2 Tax=Tetragenococcus solitarius TaxID=71453 RepID=A0ABN3Y390_9ENTE
MMFKDRTDAGEQLAAVVNPLDTKSTIVLALPRGGVPLGALIAKKYDVIFNIILAKKIGHPSNAEYAIGAIAENGKPIIGEGFSEKLHAEWLEKEILRLQKEMRRKRELYKENLQKLSLKNKEVLIVDDGIATGLTMFAAIRAVKKYQPKSVSVAVPVIPRISYEQLKQEVDEIYALEVPEYFLGGVGAYYENFPQLTDEQVKEMLENK